MAPQTETKRAHPFEDSHAKRLLTVVDDRIRRATRSEAGVETTWGQVAGVSADGKMASAYLYGDLTNASEGFRVLGPNVVAAGDKVKVAISARGDKYIVERLVTSAYRKIEIDTDTGEIRTGDGTAPPTLFEGGASAHGDLTGVTSDQHHARAHDHSNASDDDTIAPTSVTIPSTGSLSIGDIVLTRGAADRLDFASGDSLRISDTGQIQWSDIVLSRAAADLLQIDDQVRSSRTNGTDVAFAGKRTADSNPRWTIDADGTLSIFATPGDANPVLRIKNNSGIPTMEFGAGGASGVDIAITRFAANALKLSSGERWMYDPPGCIATRATTQAITTSTWTPVEYNSGDISDPFSMHDSSTNPSRFTVPAGWGGTYLCWASVGMTANATGTRLLHMSINNSTPGSTVRSVQANGNASHQQGMNLLYVQELDAGDYVEFEVWQNSGGNLNVGADAFAGIMYVGERV